LNKRRQGQVSSPVDGDREQKVELEDNLWNALVPMLATDALSDGGSLCLIQIASSSGVFLFDGIGENFATLMDAGLRDIFQNSRIVKALHDCKMDVCALLMHCGVRIEAAFDAQIAFSMIQRNPKNVSLATLVKNLTGKTHPHKASAPHKVDSQFWSHRPLVSYCLAHNESLHHLTFIAVARSNFICCS
jgi:DNA polymerase I-like protein with 3'-5' exonuclease and polymerase domains